MMPTLLIYAILLCVLLNPGVEAQGIQILTTTNPSLNHPYAVFVEASGAIYIADDFNNRVIKLAPNGTQLAVFTTSNPPLNFPNGVALDASGVIYISDEYNYRVVKLAPNGTQLAAFTTATTAVPYGIDSSLYGMAVDASGAIYTCMINQQRVIKMAANGTQLAVFTTSNPSLSEPIHSRGCLWIGLHHGLRSQPSGQIGRQWYSRSLRPPTRR